MIKPMLVATLGLGGVFGTQLLGEAREFYPTHPGDAWTYESSLRGQFTNEVTDSVLSEGSVIFRIVSTDSSGREQVLMVRQDGPRLYLGTNPHSLALLADFGLEVGASSTAQMGMQEVTLTLAARHDALEVFGTRFQDVIEVSMNQSAGDRRTYFFARGVGLVGMESDRPRDRVRLISATVEGTPIGTAAP